MRQVFVVFSSKSLPYAEKGLNSLFKNSLEPLNVTLITDFLEDKQAIVDAVEKLENPRNHQWQVFDKSEADERADEQLKNLAHLKAFRHGHPCWRKLTDPLLFSQDGEEVIILDPDLYFPNQFVFETTPNNQLLLMWQPPNCLFPPESVYTAMDASIKLAHHVDIGVAQLRAPVDLEWLNWLVGKLGGTNIPRIAHIEAIVWAAMAMRVGGGHLNPKQWLCWRHSYWKRVLLKCGISGSRILQIEDWNSLKCFHAGGRAKWWIVEAAQSGMLDRNYTLSQPSTPIPFVELTPQMYQRERRLKDTVGRLGYYAIFQPD